jgi:hypothetical protein
MLILNNTYFVGDINVPNSGNAYVGDRLLWFMKKHEPEFLQLVLGYELYKPFVAALASYPDVSAVEARFTNLLTGVEYTGMDGRLRKWRGITDVAVINKSMIANYVYCYFLRSIASQSTTMGEVTTKTENADVVSPADKMIRAWNEMVDWVYEMVYFLDSNTSVYPEWKTYNKYNLLCRIQKQNFLGI